EGPQKSDENLMLAKQREIGLAGLVIRAGAQHLDHDIGSRKHFFSPRKNSCAALNVIVVGITGVNSSSGLDDHLETRLDQVGNNHGHQRNASFSGETLFGDADDHKASSHYGAARWSEGIGLLRLCRLLLQLSFNLAQQPVSLA